MAKIPRGSWQIATSDGSQLVRTSEAFSRCTKKALRNVISGQETGGGLRREPEPEVALEVCNQSTHVIPSTLMEMEPLKQASSVCLGRKSAFMESDVGVVFLVVRGISCWDFCTEGLNQQSQAGKNGQNPESGQMFPKNRGQKVQKSVGGSKGL